MSKWLSVCIFLLLAIACVVDVEPSAPAAPVALTAPAVPVALAEPVAHVVIVSPSVPATEARDARALGEGSLASSESRILATRE